MIGYPSGQTGAISATSGLPAGSHRIKAFLYPKNPLLTKLVQSRWLNIGQVNFLRVCGPRLRLVHKHAKKELGQYPAILTLRLVNNPSLQTSLNFRMNLSKLSDIRFLLY